MHIAYKQCAICITLGLSHCSRCLKCDIIHTCLGGLSWLVLHRHMRSAEAQLWYCSSWPAAATASCWRVACITCTEPAVQVPFCAPPGQGRAVWSLPWQWLLTPAGRLESGAVRCCWCQCCAEAALRLLNTFCSWRSVSKCFLAITLHMFVVHVAGRVSWHV